MLLCTLRATGVNLHLGELNVSGCDAGLNGANVRALEILDANGGFLGDIVAIGDEAHVDLDLVK